MEDKTVFIKNLSEQVPAVPGNSILSQILLKTDQVEVTLFKFAAGQELTEHTSAYPAIIHILTGDGSMTLGPDKVEIHAGSWTYLPANLPHSLKNDTPMTMLLTQRK